MTSSHTSHVETVLRDELARANRALDGVAPVLSYVLANSGHALVSDAIVARVRGMVSDLARQLVMRVPDHSGDKAALEHEPYDALSEDIANDAPLLNHLHAVAVEAILTERLDQGASIDPVLSPLWQELIASQDRVTSEIAMQALAAQSRFMQAQRRVQHSILELPAEMLERAMRAWARGFPIEQEPSVMAAMRSLKSEYDEAESRTGLIARLVARMRQGLVAAHELEHAGFALFASALAQATGQSRQHAVLACHEQQAARLAISLRAAGLDAQAIERQFLTLEPAERLPRSLTELSIDNERALLHHSDPVPDPVDARLSMVSAQR